MEFSASRRARCRRSTTPTTAAKSMVTWLLIRRAWATLPSGNFPWLFEEWAMFLFQPIQILPLFVANHLICQFLISFVSVTKVHWKISNWFRSFKLHKQSFFQIYKFNFKKPSSYSVLKTYLWLKCLQQANQEYFQMVKYYCFVNFKNHQLCSCLVLFCYPKSKGWWGVSKNILFCCLMSWQIFQLVTEELRVNQG